MADTERENPLGFIDKRRHFRGQDAGNANGNPVAASSLDISDLGSVAGLRARLGLINGTYFTATRLNSMTKNDMVYAVRVAVDAAGIG